MNKYFHHHRIDAKLSNQIRQQGFTIVEILIAITLSMILIAGVIQIYLSSKTSFQVQSQLSRLQENQRITVDFLQRDIIQAGFNLPLGDTSIEVTEGANGTSDSITISHASDTDCLGQTTPGGIAVNQYFINVIQDENGEPLHRLMCDGNGNQGQPQPIADGVTNMQILLGENSINNSPSTYAQQLPSADRYIKAASVTNASRIVAVRIAFLIKSEEGVRKQNLPRTFTLLDTVVNTNDRFKRTVVTKTIPLRNRQTVIVAS